MFEDGMMMRRIVIVNMMTAMAMITMMMKALRWSRQARGSNEGRLSCLELFKQCTTASDPTRWNKIGMKYNPTIYPKLKINLTKLKDLVTKFDNATYIFQGKEAIWG